MNIGLNKLFTDLIQRLNSISTNKLFKKIYMKYIIRFTKRKIKKFLHKNEYDGYDIYRFLLFIDSADTLNLFDKPYNIDYCCYKSNDTASVLSGILKVLINYDDYHSLEVAFKPVVESNKSRIDIDWAIADTSSDPTDYRDISSRSRFYSKSIDILVDMVINPTEPVSETKILEWSSAAILYQTFIICIESVFKRIEMRYLNEKS